MILPSYLSGLISIQLPSSSRLTALQGTSSGQLGTTMGSSARATPPKTAAAANDMNVPLFFISRALLHGSLEDGSKEADLVTRPSCWLTTAPRPDWFGMMLRVKGSAAAAGGCPLSRGKTCSRNCASIASA